ncbi:protein kinase domain-containing protein [Aeoliella sp.]|uniref:serine/threonine-protein kinase n=1 Tax=Aeoliella sp. TaxID=2795800 RepID=UPI003CCBB235
MSSETQVDDLLDRWEDARGRGEHLSPEELCRESPELLSEVRDKIAALEQMDAKLHLRELVDSGKTEAFHYTPKNALPIRCPHCNTTTQVAVDTRVDEVVCDGCGSTFSLKPREGDGPALFNIGQFELISRLGVGGFGSVWKARDLNLRRDVAIKLPKRGQMSDTEIELFLREARSAAQLRHPNIVRVLEIGRFEDSVYIVSEFIDGKPLSEWLNAQPCDSREAAQIMDKIARAVHYAHEEGIVHRDLKPGNILIDGAGEPHVLDFGLAKWTEEELSLTLAGNPLGTPVFMPPEQVEGELAKIDRRSDIYSLGATLFQMLTGEPVFRGTRSRVYSQTLETDPPSARSLNDRVPRDLDTITEKCLRKEQVQRFQTAAELADELERYLRGEPIRTRPVGMATKVVKFARRKPAVASLIVLLVALAVGGPVVALEQSRLRADAEFATQIATDQTKISNDERGKAERRLEYVRRNVELLGVVFDRVTIEPLGQSDKQLRSQLGVLFAQASKKLPSFADDPLLAKDMQLVYANALYSLGHVEEAHAIDTETFGMLERTLGSNDLETLKALHNLAMSNEAIGNRKVAIEQMRSVYRSRLAQLGERHPDTLEAMRNLAALLGQGRRHAESLRFAKSAFELHLSVLGREDARTIHSMRLLAANEYAAENYSRGLELAEQAFESLEVSRGATHPATINALQIQAGCLAKLGRLQEALAIDRRVVRVHQVELGADHPVTLGSMASLAETLYATGLDEEGLEMERQVCEQLEARLGLTHADTVEALRNFGIRLHGKGEFVEAVRCFEKLARAIESQSTVDMDTLALKIATQILLAKSRTALLHQEAATRNEAGDGSIDGRQPSKN